MGFPVDRYKVMLAMGVKRDIFFDQHLVIVVLVFKQSCMWSVLGIETREHFLHIHLCNTTGSSIETVVCKIKTEYGHDLAEVLLYAIDLYLIVDFKGIRAHWCI